jgi:hypothetical protein
MEGDLSLLLIPDLLQMICLGGYSRDVHLFDGTTQLGVIAIRNGRIERCYGFGMWGDEAFYKLVNLRCGRYKVNDAQSMSGSDVTLTAYSWQELLMEAARRQDEAEHLAQAAVASGRVIAFPSPPAHAAMFELAVLPGSPAPGEAAPPPAPAARPGRISQTIELLGFDEPTPAPHPAISHSHSQPDITCLLEEATACYLRRDLARTEEILQRCLAMRPGDKRVLQNLERVRRKKHL